MRSGLRSTDRRLRPDAEGVKAAFDTIMRGLSRGPGEQIYSGCRALWEFGHTMVPALEQRLQQADGATVSRPDATRMQTSLATLPHDIDEARSRKVIDWLLGENGHPALRGVLNSIRRYDGRNFTVHEILGRRVFVAKEIDKFEEVASHMGRWLADAPPEDLIGHCATLTHCPFSWNRVRRAARPHISGRPFRAPQHEETSV